MPKREVKIRLETIEECKSDEENNLNRSEEVKMKFEESKQEVTLKEEERNKKRRKALINT